jgi:sugar phosphate isomerase/epimerase
MAEKNLDARLEGELMTRKDFLRTLGLLTGSAALPARARAAQAAKPALKLGVSLYSYNGDLQTGTMSIEDCLADLADMEAEGVEFLPEAIVPNYPNPPASWIDQWHRWLDRYRLRPTALDGGADTKLYRHRACSLQEIADMIVRDLRLANTLGFKVYRGLGNSWTAALGPKGSVWASGVTQFQVYDLILPYAEKYDVKIGEELHIPFVIRSPWMQETLEYIQRTKARHLGFVPDLSIFLRRPWRGTGKEDLIQRGLRRDIVEFIFKAREDGVEEEVAMAQVAKMGGGEQEARAAAMVYHMTYPRSQQNDPRDLAMLLPYIFHIHAKFYEVREDLADETSIPYAEIIPVLARAGYAGYLSSEYEGDRSPFAASHQIRRQHLMIRRMWDAA